MSVLANNKAIPITESKLLALLDLYNDLLSTNFHLRGGTEEWRHQRNIPKDKTLYDTPFYPDLVNLYSIILTLKVKPREYIMFQIKNYKPPTKMSRLNPTIRMLTTPAAVERWENQFVRPLRTTSDEESDRVSRSYMLSLMEANGIQTEDEFYRDPILISQISKSFLAKQPEFQKLVSTGYFLKTFGMAAKDLL